MGKGNMMLGLVKGKIGDVVGYRVTNSNDKQKQGWRPYRAHISNPRSLLQANRRMIIGNMTRIYGSFQPIIRRGFENIAYGGKSYQRFLKLNMNLVPDGPFVEKNYITPVPGPYKVSEGTLQPINYAYNAQSDGFKGNLASIAVPTGNTVTIAALSTALLAADSRLQEGDQLTWIVVFEYEGGAFDYRAQSIVLDTTNTTDTLTKDSHDQIQLGNTIAVQVDDHFLVDENSGLEDETPVAVACILSRDGVTDHLRSSETLAVNKADTFLAQFFTPAAKQRALESYMSPDGEIDWPTQAE